MGSRRLGAERGEAIKRWGTRCLEVKAGAPVATRAAKMQTTGDRPADIMQDKFRVLNGLASGDTLTPGRLVKIATE